MGKIWKIPVVFLYYILLVSSKPHPQPQVTFFFQNPALSNSNLNSRTTRSSSYYPRPTYTPQLVQSGQPWPANQAGYQSFSQTQKPVGHVALNERVGENENRPSIPAKPPVPPSSFHPVRVPIAQLVPPGKPWPANAEDYQNFSQIGSKPISLEDRIKDEENSGSSGGFPTGSIFTPGSLPGQTIPAKPPVAPPSFHPVPIHTPQLVPSGQPWPASAVDYQNFSQTTLRPSNQRPTQRPVITQRPIPQRPTGQRPSQGSINLEDRLGVGETIPAKPPVAPPSFHPVPIYTPQLVPEGQPWPANAEGYQNFSQTTTRPSNFNRPSSSINLEDRLGEEFNTNQQSGTIPAKPSVARPSFNPVPIYTPQLIPSGQPWPASAEGYQNFSQTTVRTVRRPAVDNFQDRLNIINNVLKEPERPSGGGQLQDQPVDKREQIIFPDDEMVKDLQNTSHRFASESGSEPTRSPSITSTHPSLLHNSQGGTNEGTETSIRPTRRPPLVIDEGMALHTSPNKPITEPPAGSLFTSKPHGANNAGSQQNVHHNRPHMTTYKSHPTTYRPHTTTYRPHTTTYRPHTTTYRPHTTTYRPHTTTYKPQQTNVQQTNFHFINPHGEQETLPQNHVVSVQGISNNPNIAVANLLPDTKFTSDTGFNSENLVAVDNEDGISPPQQIHTSATIIGSMQKNQHYNEPRGIIMAQYSSTIQIKPVQEPARFRQEYAVNDMLHRYEEEDEG